jgi:mRNA-degrading endonuclease HigB of HigAB toxin-antitoxin module
VARANWRNPADVKASYPKASILKASRVVFNIKGNDYRLVARLQFQAGILAIRFFGRMPNTTRSMRRRCDGRNPDRDR